MGGDKPRPYDTFLINPEIASSSSLACARDRPRNDKPIVVAEFISASVGDKPSQLVIPLILMLHSGGKKLEDLREIKGDIVRRGNRDIEVSTWLH